MANEVIYWFSQSRVMEQETFLIFNAITAEFIYVHVERRLQESINYHSSSICRVETAGLQSSQSVFPTHLEQTEYC